jgi:hypothetical protein
LCISPISVVLSPILLECSISPALGILVDVRHELVLEARQGIALLIHIFLVALVLVKAEINFLFVLSLRLIVGVALLLGIAFGWLAQLL